MRGVSLVGASQSEVGINSNSNFYLLLTRMSGRDSCTHTVLYRSTQHESPHDLQINADPNANQLYVCALCRSLFF